jgi:integrase
MLYAGIRPQEAKALDIRKAFDEKAGVLHITETAHRDGNNQYRITSTMKTKNAVRDVPILPPVADALKGRKGKLITSAKGKQITATTWRNAFASYRSAMETAINGCQKRWYGRTKAHKKILADGGHLQEWINFDVVPYDLRHSFCTMLRDAGVDLKLAIQWMGHADEKMILRIYDHITEKRIENAVKNVERSLEGVKMEVKTEEKPDKPL